MKIKLKNAFYKFRNKRKKTGPRPTVNDDAEEPKKKTKEELKSVITTEEPKEKGINGRIDDINEKLNILTEKAGQTKKKPFKLPAKVRTQLKKAAEQNKVLVIYLGKNRNIKPMIAKLENGFVVVNGVPHNFNLDFTFFWEGKTPCIVLPEWDLNPIGTKDYYDAVDKKRVPDAQTVIIRAMKMRDVFSDGKQINVKTWIWIVIGAIVLGYVLFGQG
jgi:hypothetical protein